MSITFADPSVETRIRDLVDRGDYADADELVLRALDALEAQENIRKVRALIAEAEADIEQHGTIPMSLDFWPSLIREADEADLRGEPIPEHVKP